MITDRYVIFRDFCQRLWRLPGGQKKSPLTLSAVFLSLALLSAIGALGLLTAAQYWPAAAFLLGSFTFLLAGMLIRLFRQLLTGMSDIHGNTFTPSSSLMINEPVAPAPSEETSTATELLNRELTQINHYLENMVQLRTNELQQAEQARKQALLNISHDLRTPLTSVQGYLEALLDGMAITPEQQTRYLNRIHARVLSINRLVDDLYDLSRLESKQLRLSTRPIPAQDLIRHIHFRFEADVSAAGLDLLVAPGGDDDDTSSPNRSLQVSVDIERIDRVFGNLLFNARRHTRPGGAIIIGASFTQISENEIIFFVRDTGSGISLEELPHIFERFYQGSSPRPETGRPSNNSGLGLAISREIIRAHGGRIWADSLPNCGSTFFFALPVCADAVH